VKRNFVYTKTHLNLIYVNAYARTKVQTKREEQNRDKNNRK